MRVPAREARVVLNILDQSRLMKQPAFLPVSLTVTAVIPLVPEELL